MAEFVAQYWDHLNWQSISAGLIISVPILLGLFKLVANHSRERLASEIDAHGRTRIKCDELEESNTELTQQFENLKLKNKSLQERIEAYMAGDSDSDRELSDEATKVLVAYSEGRISNLYDGGRISDQRIRLAMDKLQNYGFLKRGVEGFYISPEGREWLDAHDLLP